MGKPITPRLKYDKEENWKKAVNYVPPLGEIIVYEGVGQEGSFRMKVGDGVHTVNELQFMSALNYEVEDGQLKIL